MSKVTDINEYKVKQGLELLKDKGLIDYTEDGEMIGLKLNTAIICGALNEIMKMEFSKNEYETIRNDNSIEDWKNVITFYFAIRILINRDLEKRYLKGKGKVVGKIIAPDLSDEEEFNSDTKMKYGYNFLSKKTKKIQQYYFTTYVVDVNIIEQTFEHIDLDNPIPVGESKIRFTVKKEALEWLIEGAKHFNEDIKFIDGFFYAERIGE